MDEVKSEILNEDIWKFHSGAHYNCYKMFGSKQKPNDAGACTGGEIKFTLWAPNAESVSVVGDFNSWTGGIDLMRRINDSKGIWTTSVKNAGIGDKYKYEIKTADGQTLLKSDPFAYYSEVRPETSSIIYNDNYEWNDDKWIKERVCNYKAGRPVNIYEIHLGSWKRNEDGGFLNYRQIADQLSEYLTAMGYNYVELMPVMEHPFDESWGYQITGYYSVTSRYGTPEDFKYFVDVMHRNNIGVILDWVPGHFCRDGHGLYKFDGKSIYEYEDEQKCNNEWGTANFNLEIPEVQSFLISNANFYIDEFHADGLRMDAVTNILRFDYSGENANTPVNKDGGYEKIEGIYFLQRLNRILKENREWLMLFSEESGGWPGITKKDYLGGIGFDYNWNLGWMHDALGYFELPYDYRKFSHKLLNFSLTYAFSESYIQPLSHDEVVHGKHSMFCKMFGNKADKAANLRALFAYMICHPGRKLNFMGNDFGQLSEWSYNKELEWRLLGFPLHRGINACVHDLNNLYINEPALWQNDSSEKSFSWIDCDNAGQNVLSFVRYAKNKDEMLVVICNFSDTGYDEYKVGVPRFTEYYEIFNSDSEIYCGGGRLNTGKIMPAFEEWNGQPFYISIALPSCSVMIFKPKFYKNTERSGDKIC